jgi:cytochrome b561
MPILGWCLISAKGTYIIPFGLPPILEVMARPDVIEIKNIHEYFAYIGLAVIFVHASVAIIESVIVKRINAKS